MGFALCLVGGLGYAERLEWMQYIAERTGSRTWALSLHIIVFNSHHSASDVDTLVSTENAGNEAKVRTKAAVSADEDLMSKAELIEVSPDKEAW